MCRTIFIHKSVFIQPHMYALHVSDPVDNSFRPLTPRRGSRIQKGGGGGGRTFRRGGGGGGSYRNFRSGSKLLQGPGQINKHKKLQTAVGGGASDHPKKTLYPRLTPVCYCGSDLSIFHPHAGQLRHAFHAYMACLLFLLRGRL